MISSKEENVSEFRQVWINNIREEISEFLALLKNQIFMLYAYAKNEQDDLTKEQLSVLREVVNSEFKNEK